MFSPTNILMLILICTSIIVVFSSSSMFSMWLALEINTISFTALLFSTKNQESAESCIKYFLPQALASSLFLLACVSPGFGSVPLTISESMMTIAMAIKLGMAPFHYWFPVVASKLSWSNNSLLMTIQKLPPLVLISFIKPHLPVMLTLIFLSSVVGTLGGLNQVFIKNLMAFSSISHLSWMLASIHSSAVGFVYLFFYSLIVLSIFSILNPKVKTLNQILFESKNKMIKPFFILLLFSLGGLPPTTGFFQKWLVISLNLPVTIMVILIISAVTNIFFYTRLVYPSLFINLPAQPWAEQPKNFKMMITNSMLSVCLLPFSLLMFFFLP